MILPVSTAAFARRAAHLTERLWDIGDIVELEWEAQA